MARPDVRGKPLVKVTAFAVPDAAKVRRRGFTAGQIATPPDFDRILIAQALVEGITPHARRGGSGPPGDHERLPA